MAFWRISRFYFEQGTYDIVATCLLLAKGIFEEIQRSERAEIRRLLVPPQGTPFDGSVMLSGLSLIVKTHRIPVTGTVTRSRHTGQSNGTHRDRQCTG